MRLLSRIEPNKLRLILFALLLFAIVLPLPTHGANPDCATNALPARLMVGGVARVAYSFDRAEIPLNEYPGLNARQVGVLANGVPLNVVRGPTCADNHQWWQVRTLTGAFGWASEGESETKSQYALEPWQILLDVARPAGSAIDLVRVNDHALMRLLTRFDLTRIAGSAQHVFPPPEYDPYVQALDETRTACPTVLARNEPIYARLGSAEALPADLGLYSAYPSPDATRLIVVRHLWRTAAHCDGSQSPIYGIERVSLIGFGGEQLLLDLPANASLPGLPPHVEGTLNRVVDVRWSPDNLRAVAWAQFGNLPRLLILDARSGNISILDTGQTPTWTADGDHLVWLRRDGGVTNLLIARPDGTQRQTIALPPSLQYTDAPILPTWNEAGTWLVACTQKGPCESVVPVDIASRRTLPPLRAPFPASGVRWVLGDSALLWLPISGGNFALQPLQADRPAQTLSVSLLPGEHIEDVRPFPAGKAALVIARAVNGTSRYIVLDLEGQRVQAVADS